MIALDCTFRDGGYQNDWNFSFGLVERYIDVMNKSLINAIELGFRKPNSDIKSFANVTDEFIIENKLYIPNAQYIGVMINNGDFITNDINQTFKPIDKSQINLVRVATHFKDIKAAEKVCKSLKDLGYTVGCNLMQAASRSFDEIKNAAEYIKKWNAVDVIYIADSLGGMKPNDVNYAFNAIKEGWSDAVTGFHAHNNQAQALDNSLEAIDIGVEWIDCTITGMGRGPGNTETEYLLFELNKRGFGDYHLTELYKLILRNFVQMKNRLEWGPSLLYYLAAEYEIHPTYIQKLLSLKLYHADLLKAIEFLKKNESNSFNQDLLEGAIK